MKKNIFTQVGIGIDISKADFRACIMGNDGKKTFKVIASRKFANTTKGFSDFCHWVNKHLNKYEVEEVEYIMEATGVYHENLAWELYENQLKVIIVLPNQAKAFLKSEGIKSKTDKIDAQGLAKMVLVKKLRYWQPISPVLKALRTLTRYYEITQKELTQNYNRLHALEHSHKPDKFILKQLKQHLKFLEKQKENIYQQILETTQKDETLHKKMKHLTTIYGIGILTVAVVVAETNGFELFNNQKQLMSYSGYDIVEHQSGKYNGQTRISKKGNTHIRRALFFPALQTVKEENIFQELYVRVFDRTKKKMKAYTAVQRKLLVIMYTLWKKEVDFDHAYKKQNFVEEQDALLH